MGGTGVHTDVLDSGVEMEVDGGRGMRHEKWNMSVNYPVVLVCAIIRENYIVLCS